MQNAQYAIQMLHKLTQKNAKNEPAMQSLIIAHHNIGIEYGHLKDRQQALQSYIAGHKLAMTHLGTQHQLTKTLE